MAWSHGSNSATHGQIVHTQEALVELGEWEFAIPQVAAKKAKREVAWNQQRYIAARNGAVDRSATVLNWGLSIHDVSGLRWKPVDCVDGVARTRGAPDHAFLAAMVLQSTHVHLGRQSATFLT